MVHVHHQNIGNTSISMVHGFQFASCVFISLPEGLARVARGVTTWRLVILQVHVIMISCGIESITCSNKNVHIWAWVNTYRYIFSGMNIHLPAILGFTRGTRFWHIPIYIYIYVFDMLYTTWCYICAMFNMNRYIYICYTQMRTMVLEYAHLHDWAIFGVNVGKYSIHGASGISYILQHL